METHHNTPVGATVHIVSIDHKFGTTTFVHASYEGAQRALHEWVVENWTLSAGIPHDRDQAIEDYFDPLGGESYSLAEETVMV